MDAMQVASQFMGSGMKDAPDTVVSGSRGEVNAQFHADGWTVATGNGSARGQLDKAGDAQPYAGGAGMVGGIDPMLLAGAVLLLIVALKR